MNHTPLNDTTGYWGDEEVDYYRDQVFEYTDRVLAGEIKVTDVPMEYRSDVIDRVFYEKTGRRCTVESRIRGQARERALEDVTQDCPLDNCTPHCPPKVSTDKLDMSGLI